MSLDEIAEHTMNLALKKVKVDPAGLAVESIFTDIFDRKGIKHTFSDLDEEIKNEIKALWKIIIMRCYSKYFDDEENQTMEELLDRCNESESIIRGALGEGAAWDLSAIEEHLKKYQG